MKAKKKPNIKIVEDVRRPPKKKRSIFRKIVDKILKPVSAPTPAVRRNETNPIIQPNRDNGWESKAAFNPGALYSEGKVHLVYRAVGDDDVSVLGYASSVDGVNITERLDYPIFFKGRIDRDHLGPKISYSSGGGWNGGCEDPRLTLVDKTVYLLYTAFDGWGSLRMAMARISLEDFLKKRFNWSQPVYISRPGEIHKNWVIFPEKIGGKFALLHSVNPEVQIEYIDDLSELGRDKYVNSFYGSRGSTGKKSVERWDSWVRGAGPPPIKTKYGWLLLYHAMSDKDPNRYKLGAMILDLKNPTKILYRSRKPLLEPDECYENEGLKAGVVYACGAVVISGQIFIYYGGADMVSCVATADLESLLQQIMRDEKPVLKESSRDSTKRLIKFK